MQTLRRSVFPLAVSAGLALLAGAAAMSLPLPVAAATTGAGFSGITPYGGYLGNYIAPDGTRVYCIDADRDWPSGPTDAGVVTDSLSTGWGDPLTPETLQKFNYVLAVYGQTADPVQAAAVNAYLYAYTSGIARRYGASYEAGLHYIDGNHAVAETYATIWSDTEARFASAHEPTAALTIDMSEPLRGEVLVITAPEGAVGTLTLEGAVVADTSASTVPVVGGDRVAITGAPGVDASTYTIAANASFQTLSGYPPQVTLYVTESQQRTIREAGLAQVEFASSARLDVSLPTPPEPEVPTLAATGSPVVGMLGVGLALVAVGSLSPLVRRSREYAAASRVVPQRE